MVAVGILAIIMSAMTTMQTNLQNETRALTEKMSALELEKNYNFIPCRRDHLFGGTGAFTPQWQQWIFS